MDIKRLRGGFTLLEIMLVVAIIGTLASIAVPAFVSAHATSGTNACHANLKQLDSAIMLFHVDNGVWPDDFESDLAPYMRNINPRCPVDGSDYVLNPASGGNTPYTSCPTHGNVAGQ